MITFKTKSLSIGLLALLTASVAAHAEDHWQGFYAGVDVGYVKANDDGKEYDLNGSWNGWKQNLNPDGLSLGLTGGHNWMMTDKVLLGLEANYKTYNAKDKAYQKDAVFGGDCAPATDCIFRTEIDQSFSLLGRAGYLFNEKMLGYVIGGYSSTKIKRSVWDGWNQVANMHYNKWQDGWTLGAGIEYMLLESLSAKLEYRYTDLGKYKYNTPAFGGQIEKQKYDQDEINFGLNYHF